jgi:chromosomal replication initiator protein
MFVMLWEKTKDSLKEKLPESIHSLWIKPLECRRLNEHSIELACPDKFFSTWVANNYLEVIRESLAEVSGISFQVTLSTDNSKEDTIAPAGIHATEEKQQLRFPDMPEIKSQMRCLHPRYTFDEFMVGESNLLAQSACLALSKGDTSLGNFLYINAGSGLGKSHLTHAVAHEVINEAPGTRLHYLTALQFANEMVSRIKNNSMHTFKEKYHHNCDILLIEDVHTITGKAKTQTEMNEVLDALLKAGKRIILTGSATPREIPDIEAGFRSRMSAGLISTIMPPCIKTRIRIIRRKASNCNLALDDKVVQFLASHLKDDVRQMESAIVGLKAKSTLLQMQPDLEMARQVVTDIVGSNRELSVETIREFVAEHFKVSVEDMQSRSRKKEISFPRQLSMYMTRKYTEQGLSEIGKAFNRDHSTVVHAIKVITEAIARNSSVKGQVELLSKKLMER